MICLSSCQIVFLYTDYGSCWLQVLLHKTIKSWGSRRQWLAASISTSKMAQSLTSQDGPVLTGCKVVAPNLKQTNTLTHRSTSLAVKSAIYICSVMAWYCDSSCSRKHESPTLMFNSAEKGTTKSSISCLHTNSESSDSFSGILMGEASETQNLKPVWAQNLPETLPETFQETSPQFSRSFWHGCIASKNFFGTYPELPKWCGFLLSGPHMDKC